MRILIIGAGAIGGYVGGLLALASHEVVFAVREGTADHLRANGLRIEGPRGSWRVAHVVAADDPAGDPGRFDLALSCVKLYDAQASARHWKPWLDRADAVVSLQNGVDGQHRMSSGLDGRAVYGGIAYVVAKAVERGVITYQSDMSSIIVGGPGALADPVLAALEAASRDINVRLAAFETRRLEDIASAQWIKFTILATNAALTCLVRAPAGTIYHEPRLLALTRQSIGEVIAVGRAEAIRFPDGHDAWSLAQLQGLPAPMVASMHHDLMAGRPLELDGLSGVIVRLGERHGIATPFHSMAYACLGPHAQGTVVR